MARRHSFSNLVTFPSNGLPPTTYGRLAAQFQFSSPTPLQGGHDTGRHIYLALKVPSGSVAGIYECAFNIRSDEGTEVLYAERRENIATTDIPTAGFVSPAHLAYGTGPDDNKTDYLDLTDADFQAIENDSLYQIVTQATQGSIAVVVYGVTYSAASHGKAEGIHDVHMNSGTNPGDSHARDDRVRQDGAIVFYFDMGSGKALAHWVLVKFNTQHVVNY